MELLENELQAAIDSKNQAMITKIRCKLIKAIKEEINKCTDDEKRKELDDRLKDLLSSQRIQLDARYKNEFLKGDGSIEELIKLPKGVGLGIKKIANCIEELKAAKTFKDKLKEVLETAKSVGMTAGAPVIAVGKTLVHYWYIPLLALSLLKVTDNDLLKKITNKIPALEKLNNGLDDARDGLGFVYSGFDNVTDDLLGKVKDKVPDSIQDEFKIDITDELVEGAKLGR